MRIPAEVVGPYLVSNLVGLALLVAVVHWPSFVRWSLVVIFLGAGLLNAVTALRTPAAYVNFADLAIAPYARFIQGWFADHVRLVVLPIAAGQLAIGLLLATGGRALRCGVAGAVVFLLAIAPLGAGSAFPLSLFLSSAALIIMVRVADHTMPAHRQRAPCPSHVLPRIEAR